MLVGAVACLGAAAYGAKALDLDHLPEAPPTYDGPVALAD
jgi:hypothetical protein